MSLSWFALALMLLTLPLQSTPAPAPASTQAGHPSVSKPTNVLFICPHGAGKSVLASAYFKQLAAERGITVQTDAVGTEPDPQVGPPIAARLKEQGLPVPISKPRAVTSNDIERADIVISIGCDVSRIPKTPKLRQWDDVPNLSDDFNASDAAIRAKARALVDEISRMR
jgi:arsenate reductase (thioredoxin)